MFFFDRNLKVILVKIYPNSHGTIFLDIFMKTKNVWVDICVRNLITLSIMWKCFT